MLLTENPLAWYPLVLFGGLAIADKVRTCRGPIMISPDGAFFWF